MVRADKAAMRHLLQLLSTGDQRILREVPPALDEDPNRHDDGESRYELFHDVLAVAALEWYGRFDAEEQRRETEEKLVRESKEASPFTNSVRGARFACRGLPNRH
jgi:hypothetical protein